VQVHGLWFRLGLCSILCGAGPAACSKREKTASRASCKFKHRVAVDTTLSRACSPYTIRGGIDVVDGATLTIEAGVELRFSHTDWLEIAAAGTRGARLVARGTPEQPIVITGTDTDAIKTWYGLWFNSGTAPGSVLSNAIIRSGGGDNKDITPALVQGCIALTGVADGAVAIENVLVENCTNAGVVLKDSRPRMTGIRIKDTAIGFLLDGVTRDAVPAAATYANVKQEVVEGPAGR